MKTPVARLTAPAGLVWMFFALVGPALILFGSDALSEVGKGMLLLSSGFLFFGLWLEPERVQVEQADAKR